MRRKRQIKYLPNKDVLLLIREQIAAGRSVRLPVRGNSMSPLLLDQRDTVLLRPVDPVKIKMGDVILYSWKDGFVMHRVVGIEESPAGLPERFICRGDALQNSENVPIEDVIAIAELPAHSFLTLMVRRVWLRLRGWLGRLRRWLRRLR
ncbi:MAG TPA: hypothetical protein P5167_05945 [Bacteroidales bacterium]|nr:hypothetical protein [Bacteroidales bacterium]HRW95370.1 hypothetical protein [Bacteroidales bacterium]